MVFVLIASFSVSAWQSNCYLVAPAPGGPGVVIDPGPGAAARVLALAAEHDVRIAAVLATHGHVDHVADAAELCEATGVPLWIHPADRFMLTDPAGGIAPGSEPMLAQLLGHAPDGREPGDVRDLPDEGVVEAAGISWQAQVAPGHSAGCTLLTLKNAGPQGEPVCFAGDVVFAGSIGRTDLATGDPAAMQRTLRDIVATMDPATLLLPGHGPQTTLARELRTNPYLALR